MALTLRIENHDSLPDGGPLSATVTEAGLEVGRDSAMGWTLPDDNRFISSRHFEVRHERGAYWLYDLSTNGTFLNGGASRVKSPHRLANGDRLQVGPYRIVVEESASAAPTGDPFATSAPPAPGGAFGGGGGGGGDIWSLGGGGGPAPASNFDPRPARRLPDFGDQHLEMPRMNPVPTPAPPEPAASPFAPAPASSGAAASPFGHPAHPGGGQQSVAPGASPFGTTAPSALQPPAMQPASAGASASPFAPAGMPGGAAAHPVTAPPGHAGAPYESPGHGHAAALPPADEGFHPRAGAAPVAQPQHAPAPPPTGASAGVGTDGRALVDAICAGAGLAPGSLSGTDPAALGNEIGRMLRLLTEELSALLRARAATKQSVRSGQRTMIGASDNNPLKFMPTPDEALDAMLGRPRPGFMRGAEAVQSGFADVKQHQYATHAALQPALARLLEDLAPEAIESKTGGSLMSSRKARAWDLFVERWDAKTHPYENGMLDVFLTYYAEAYDQASKKRG